MAHRIPYLVLIHFRILRGESFYWQLMRLGVRQPTDRAELLMFGQSTSTALAIFLEISSSGGSCGNLKDLRDFPYFCGSNDREA